MSIHRSDRPNAPYRIYQSIFPSRAWIWQHRHPGAHPAGGRAFDTREDAMAAAERHARDQHPVDHLRARLAEVTC